MKENFQIHIWLGLLLCLLGMSCSDDTPAKGDDPGNGNTELEVNEWIESVMRSDYLWNNDIPAQNKLDFSADPQTFFRSMLSLKDGKTRNGKHLYYYSYMEKNKDYKARTSIDADDTYGMEFTLFNVVNDSNQPLGYYYARILYVLPNSPASSAGLERGDWIVGVKGKNNINSDNYGILLNGYGFKIFTTTFLLENSDLICIILAVLIPLYLGSDFENRTINNKISAGYTRKEIYIVELIVSSICATVLFVADILSVFTSSNIAGLEFSDKVNVTEFAFHAAIAFVCIITVSALYTMIVMISHKQLISLGIAVILTLALLTLGGKSVSSLNQSSTWTDPITHEIVENPLRIDSFARTANNIHVLVSPFAQAEFHSYLLFESEFGTKEETSLIFKDFPYHIEFCLFNILEILLFYKIGIRIFRKQDLK
jgi:ABC-type transport system involved in multi-copper enzyme maturation permease subunit